MPDSRTHPTPAVLNAVDCVDQLQTIQDALLGLESLIEPCFGSDHKRLNIDRAHLYALVATVNTRFVLDLDTARQAVQACCDGGAA